MRRLILIATITLLASQAHAGGSRSLSLAASTADHQATEHPATTATAPPQATQVPPANVQTANTTPISAPPTAATPNATAPVQSNATPAADTTTTPKPKPKHRKPSVEARVVRELHRHGIYW